MNKKLHTGLLATAAVLALGAALPASAAMIVPEGDAGTALRLTDDTRPAGRIEGLGNVHGLALAPNRGLLIAGSLEEVAAGSATRPKGVSEDEHAAHHGGGMKADANAADVGLVTFVDLATGEIRRKIEVPGMVHHVTVDSGERWAVVTHPSLEAVSVIDIETGEVTATVPTGANPNYAVFDDRQGLFYVSNAGDDTLVPVDPVAGRALQPIATPGGVEHMVIDTDARRIWGAEANAGRVDEIDLDTGAVVRSFEIGGELHGIALDRERGAVYVAAREQGKIARIDLAAGTVSLSDAGPEPYHMELDGARLVVSSAEEDVLWAFSLPDLKRVAEVPTRARGHQMVVLPR